MEAIFYVASISLCIAVDEKERKHGNDPEKDIDNQGFLEYMKRFVFYLLMFLCLIVVRFFRYQNSS